MKAQFKPVFLAAFIAAFSVHAFAADESTTTSAGVSGFASPGSGSISTDANTSADFAGDNLAGTSLDTKGGTVSAGMSNSGLSSSKSVGAKGSVSMGGGIS